MRFGMPMLDPGLEGPVLLRAQPGVDATPFIDHAITDHGGPIVYLTADRPPQRVRTRCTPTAHAHFLDAHGPHMGLPPDGDAVDMQNPLTLVHALERAARDRPDAMLVLADLSSIALQAGPRFEAAWPRIRDAALRFREVLVVYTDWTEAPADLHTFTEVRLLAVTERILTHQYVRLRRDGRTGQPVMYRSDGGRLRAYVPKVVVIGPGDAGKTTLIHSLCPDAVSTERHGTSVVGDRGTCRLDGMDVELFGTPGQARFDAMLPRTLENAMGIILVVDASDPSAFQRAGEMLAMVRGAGRHILIVANKQDQANAIEPERLAAALQLTDGTPVVGCDARHGSSARAALGRLLEDVLEVAA